MAQQKKNQFMKKFQRRTAIVMALYYASILSAFEDAPDITGLSSQNAGICRPFAPHITVLSSAEIQVSWLPVTPTNGVELGRYELYQGDELEYSGHDLEHIAKRLRPNTIYDFKVRACGALPGTCSEFSIARYAKTDSKPLYGEGTALTSSYLGKRNIFFNVLPGLTFAAFVMTLCFAVIYGYRYIHSYFGAIPESDVVSLETLLFGPSSIQVLPLRHLPDCTKERASSCHLTLTNSETEEENEDNLITPGDIESGIGNKSQQTAGKNPSTSLEYEGETQDQKSKDNELAGRKRSPSTRRKRTRSIRKQRPRESDNQASSTSVECVDELVSRELAQKGNCDVPGLSGETECVVLVDNSNIFIGARETACAECPKLRPKHVKMRLHALVNVLENGRVITKGFAGCSSPPASDHVWEVYRRLGYTVDLEDRRGKDEQRVDELLHLEIYKALIDFSPRTLVLATGDGNKGKSKTGSSFISCACAAMDHGWKVEVHSWEHCLSSEWLKVARRYEQRLKICYLDVHLQDIVHIDR